MYAHQTQALAQQRIADLHAEAAASRLAASARAANGPATHSALVRRASRFIRSLGGRRYEQIELVWPDGVSSVVPARSDDARPLTSSRR